MMDGDAPLRGQVMLADHLALAQAPRRQAPIPRWDLPAKVAAGKRIGQEESHRAWLEAQPGEPHNNQFDAMRHARWSQRMAQEIDPVFSMGAGLYHEAGDVWDVVNGNINKKFYPQRLKPGQRVPTLGQTLAESSMDMHNNLEGVRAAIAHRPINTANLQTSPTVAAP